MEINEFTNLLNLLGINPNAFQGTVKINGETYSIVNDENGISLKALKEEVFDDSLVKEEIADYKELIEELDDDIFIDAIDEIKAKISLKLFDELLKKESFNEEEANAVSEMIHVSMDIFKKHLENKIQSLLEIYLEL